MIFGVVALGVLHGMVFFPALLSFVPVRITGAKDELELVELPKVSDEQQQEKEQQQETEIDLRKENSKSIS